MRPLISTCFLAMLVLNSTVFAGEISDINILIDKYGKNKIIDYILSRRGAILININGNIEEVTGAPSDEFVSASTIRTDLSILKTTPAEVMRNLAKNAKENVQNQQQENKQKVPPYAQEPIKEAGSGTGATWNEQSRMQHTITNGQQLRGKYARYPTETEVFIECLPSRLLRSVHIRKDFNAVFLRDGDMVQRSENNYRSVREYGSRFSTIDEAAKAACNK